MQSKLSSRELLRQCNYLSFKKLTRILMLRAVLPATKVMRKDRMTTKAKEDTLVLAANSNENLKKINNIIIKHTPFVVAKSHLNLVG